jgi:hypothetical protein
VERNVGSASTGAIAPVYPYAYESLTILSVQLEAPPSGFIWPMQGYTAQTMPGRNPDTLQFSGIVRLANDTTLRAIHDSVYRPDASRINPSNTFIFTDGLCTGTCCLFAKGLVHMVRAYFASIYIDGVTAQRFCRVMHAQYTWAAGPAILAISVRTDSKGALD